MMKTYSQLTCEQRRQISILIKIGISQKIIAEMVGVSHSAIGRELKRNTRQRGYGEKQAQTPRNTRRQNTEKAIKMTPEMIALIEKKLEAKRSPDQISDWIF